MIGGKMQKTPTKNTLKAIAAKLKIEIALFINIIYLCMMYAVWNHHIYVYYMQIDSTVSHSRIYLTLNFRHSLEWLLET